MQQSQPKLLPNNGKPHTPSNLTQLCTAWGVKIIPAPRTCTDPYSGIIFFCSEDHPTIALAHEMGHIVTLMRGESFKRFPHLRLFKESGKHRFKSDKYRRSMLAEEREAWRVAEELLNDLESSYDKQLFETIKKESLYTYEYPDIT